MATSKTPAAPVVALTLTPENTAAVNTIAVALAKGDASFEAVMSETATAVARVLTDKPTFAHWECVADAFQSAYKAARGCTDETSRKRWVAVCSELQTRFGQEKPGKPTPAAAAKADQRKTATDEAAAMIAKAKASTAQDILALATGDTPLTKAVISALGKAATDKAAESTKSANEAAKVETKKLRMQCLDVLGKLNKAQLTQTLLAITAIQAGHQVTIKAAKAGKQASVQEPAKV